MIVKMFEHYGSIFLIALEDSTALQPEVWSEKHSKWKMTHDYEEGSEYFVHYSC